MLSGGAGDGSSQGGFILKEYVASWDEFQKISRRLPLADHYVGADLISRYGGLLSGFQNNDVALWKYYSTRVKTAVDLKSGIASITVKAYRPEFAEQLAGAVLTDAVAHMNTMSRQQEADLVDAAERKRDALQAALRSDQAAIAAYRVKTGLYDPRERYQADLGLINSLSEKHAELGSQYESVKKAAPNSPDAQNLKTAMASVQSQITGASSKFADLGRASGEYDRLITARDNDLALFQAADSAVEQARQRAIQNRYYLEVISQPSRPRTAELPHRLWWIGGIFAASLLFWSLLR